MTSNQEYIRKNKVIPIDDDGNTKLHYAAALNNYAEVEKEVAKKQKLDCENYLGWTPLMMAVRNGNIRIVDYLLENRANATKINKFGMNVFLISVTSGSLDMVTKILNHLLSGGVSRQNIQKIFSPISLAIMYKQSHITKYLIERSFDVNCATPFTGITPLMFAAAIGDNKTLKTLIQNKAKVGVKNCLGKTAQDITNSKNQRIDIDNNASKLSQNQVPYILINSPITATPANSPQYLQLTPLQLMVTNQTNIRKSSNTCTPSILPPNITPIVPQIFFPPDFTQNHYFNVSPGHLSYTNDLLNAAITSPSAFFSPVNFA